MRIFFIPGFGEDVSIFDKIQVSVPGEKVFIDNWSLLRELNQKGLTVLVYAKYITERFQIKKEDVVIGHSMGGWIALYIKQLSQCRIVQIASWTDRRKIIMVPIERHFIYWAAKQGIGFYPWVLHFLIWLHYKNKPSGEIFARIFERLKKGNKETVVKQLKVIFHPEKVPVTVTADLRIHAKADHIVKPPDQNFHPVPGDHFTLYTYPETVYEPILKFLNLRY